MNSSETEQTRIEAPTEPYKDLNETEKSLIDEMFSLRGQEAMLSGESDTSRTDNHQAEIKNVYTQLNELNSNLAEFGLKAPIEEIRNYMEPPKPVELPKQERFRPTGIHAFKENREERIRKENLAKLAALDAMDKAKGKEGLPRSA